MSTPKLPTFLIALSVLPVAAGQCFAQPATTQPSVLNTVGNIPPSRLNSGTNASNTTFWRGDGTWVAPAGGGNVSSSGTPTAGEIAEWTSSNTIEGIAPGQIPGTSTNDNASAGNVGEFISSTVLVGSAVSVSSVTAFNVTSISLTAGDWDVWGTLATNPGGSTTQVSCTGWLTTSSATIPTIPNNGAFNSLVGISATTGLTMPLGRMRLSLSATTTVFLEGFVNFTGTDAAYGFIGARRVR
jgi:hypothetical protein